MKAIAAFASHGKANVETVAVWVEPAGRYLVSLALLFQQEKEGIAWEAERHSITDTGINALRVVGEGTSSS